MSEAIRLRAEARERRIWPAFLYNVSYSSDIEDDRVIIFGLYAGTYKHGHNYLSDIYTEDLQRLVDDYNTKLSELDEKEQALVLDIAARRYVFNVELLIQDAKLETERYKLEAGEQELDARLDALEADREALNTLSLKIEIATEQAETRIKELEAQIGIEIVNEALVDQEIAEKELAVARADLKILQTAIRALEIQVSIAELAVQIVEVETRKSQIRADIAGYDARIAEAGLTASQKEVEEAEYNALLYEVTYLAAKKIELIEKEGEIISEETEWLTEEEQKRTELYIKKLEQIQARYDSDVQSNDNREATALMRREQAEYMGDLLRDLAQNDKDSVLREVGKRKEINNRLVENAFWHWQNAVELAEILAEANITSTLTHTIGSAE